MVKNIYETNIIRIYNI